MAWMNLRGRLSLNLKGVPAPLAVAKLREVKTGPPITITRVAPQVGVAGTAYAEFYVIDAIVPLGM